MKCTNEKGPKTLALICKTKKIIIYFLSSWIANLGVVPLLRLAAFLFCPIFFFLLTLRFLVILVFDTISQPLFTQILTSKKLARSTLLPICLIFVNSSYALETFGTSGNQHNGQVFMRIGQLYPFEIKGLKNFALSHKDIISAKFLNEKNKLMVRAKKVGHSQVVFWAPQMQFIDIKVLPKKQYDAYLEIRKQLQESSISYEYLGGTLNLSGKISSKMAYEKLVLLKQKFKFNELGLELDFALQTNLEIELIRQLHHFEHLSYECVLNHTRFNCFYPPHDPPKEKMLLALTNKVLVNFKEDKNKTSLRNHQLLFKVIELQSNDSESLSLGPFNLAITYKELLNSKFKDLLYQESINLSQFNTEISNEAIQNIYVQLNKDATFTLGQENEFKSIDKDGNAQSTWKFSGLKIKVQLSMNGQGYHLKYESESTSRSGKGTISGTKGEGEIEISPNKPIMLFDLSQRENLISEDQIPVLGNIPLLGSLFSYEQEQLLFKRFIVYATLVGVNQ